MKNYTTPRKGSKSLELLNYIKSNSGVTVKDFAEDLDIYSHTSLIHNLRHRHNIPIDCEMQKGANKVRYGIYRVQK